MKHLLQLLILVLFVISCGDPKPKENKEDRHKKVLKEFFESRNYKYNLEDVRFTTTELFSNKAACLYANENLYNRISGILRSGISNDSLVAKLELEQKTFEECNFPEGEYQLVKYKFSFEVDTDYEYFIIIDSNNKVFYAGNVYKQ